MADSVKMKVRNAMVYNLQQVDGTGSYNGRIMEVSGYPVWNRNKFQSKPAVAIMNIKDVGLNDGPGNYINGVQRKYCDVVLDCVLDWQGETDLADAQDKIQADIERRLGNFPWLPESASGANTATCQDVVFIDAIPYGSEETAPECGIIITYRVYYQQLLTDPNTRV